MIKRGEEEMSAIKEFSVMTKGDESVECLLFCR